MSAQSIFLLAVVSFFAGALAGYLLAFLRHGKPFLREEFWK